MKVALLVAATLLVAGCGGKKTTDPSNTASRNVAKPLERALGVDFANASVRLERAGNNVTRVTLDGDPGGRSTGR